MNLLREPLLHFFVIGAALFGGYHIVNAGKGPAHDEIVVSSGQLAAMAATFAQTWQRQPTTKELDALVDDHVHDEVLYRQGVAMGLDKDDTVIRRRVRQKMEFVADLTSDVEPTDTELKAFVAKHPEWFSDEASFSFEQVYFSGGKTDAATLNRLVGELNSGTADPLTAGDAFMPGSDFHNLSRSVVAQTFGDGFSSWMDSAKPGTWQGPVTSGYGTHLVRVTERVEARALPFEKVRDAAQREWLHETKAAANAALYKKLRENYVVTVENIPAGTIEDRRAEVTP